MWAWPRSAVPGRPPQVSTSISSSETNPAGAGLPSQMFLLRWLQSVIPPPGVTKSH